MPATRIAKRERWSGSLMRQVGNSPWPKMPHKLRHTDAAAHCLYRVITCLRCLCRYALERMRYELMLQSTGAPLHACMPTLCTMPWLPGSQRANSTCFLLCSSTTWVKLRAVSLHGAAWSVSAHLLGAMLLWATQHKGIKQGLHHGTHLCVCKCSQAFFSRVSVPSPEYLYMYVTPVDRVHSCQHQSVHQHTAVPLTMFT